MLRTDALDYHLPEDRIATRPAEPRDSARLMVVSRSDTGLLEHVHVRDIGSFLRSRDLLVVNSTRVVCARLEGARVDTNGRVTGLWLGSAAEYGHVGGEGGRRWVVMLGGARLREGVVVRVVAPGAVGVGRDEAVLKLIAREPSEAGAWLVEVEAAWAGAEMMDAQILERIGSTPLPPYILKARERGVGGGGEAGLESEAAPSVSDESYDRGRYQTVYAQGVGEVGKKVDGEGASVAAPTAGLHFTAGLLAALREKGVERAEVTLHVGTGTFRTVETEFVEQHRMHTERCSMDAGVVGEVLKRKAEGGRVICVGTTSARTVESYAREWARESGGACSGGGLPGMLATDILITPGYAWRWTDGLMTNFHLPKSTLMAMVGSLLEDGQAGAGIDRLKRLYGVAIERGYRFYSYGDAMLVLP